MPISTVIATVGSSILRNLERKLGSEFDVKTAVHSLKKLSDPINERMFGAEINSIASLIDEAYIDSAQNLYFIVSDTDDGEKAGEILKGFFEDNPFGLEFNKVEVVKINDLNDKNPEAFKKQGLRNLVKTLARIYKDHNGNILINATGGYKAQIAIASVFGQAFKVPVYYRFEAFNKIIQLLPIPMKVDTTVLKRYLKLFVILDCRSQISKEEFFKITGFHSIGAVDNDLKVLIDWDKRDVWMNHLGQIYFEHYDLTYEEVERIIRSGEAPEKKLILGDDPTFRKVASKIMNMLNAVASLPPISKVYSKAAGKKGTSKRVSINLAEGDAMNMMIGTDKGNISVRLLLAQKCSSDKVKEVIKVKIEEVVNNFL